MEESIDDKQFSEEVTKFLNENLRAMKLTERIPLDEFAYVEVEADSLDELIVNSQAVKECDAYKDRLHKPLNPVSSTGAQPRIHSDQSQANHAGAGVCPVCGMGEIKQIPAGVSKKTGKEYNAFWACSNRTCKQTWNFDPQKPKGV